jgi:hypothetical protein
MSERFLDHDAPPPPIFLFREASPVELLHDLRKEVGCGG